MSDHWVQLLLPVLFLWALETLTLLRQKTEEGGTLMEDMCSAFALPFRIGSTLCDTAIEITQLNLITETARLLPDRTAALAEEGCASDSGEVHEDDIMRTEETGDGVNLEAWVVPSCDKHEIASVEPEQWCVNSSSGVSSPSVVSDSSCSMAEELPLLDAAPEAETPNPAYPLVKDFGCPSLEGLNSETPIIAGDDSPMEVRPVDEPINGQATQEIRAGGASKCSQLMSSRVPLWGHVSICGRRPEMEDGLAVVPHFSEIPARMLAETFSADGGLEAGLTLPTAHFFGVYDGHGGPQVILSSFQ